MDPDGTEGCHPRPRGRVALALGAASIGFAIHAGALGAGLVYDDVENVLRNPWLRSPGGLGHAFTRHMAAFSPAFDTSYYRPVMHVLLAAVRAVAGLNPVGYHLAVLLLHAASCAAVFALLDRLARTGDGPPAPGGPLAAAAGALLFAVHPVHVEPVAWVSGVVDVSCGLLSILALLALLSPRAGGRLALAPLLFLAALLAKEPAVMLLPAFAAWALARGDHRDASRRRELLHAGGALAAALAVYLALRVNALGGLMGSGGGHRVAVGLGEGLLTALALLGAYARLLVVPSGLSVVHDFPLATGLGDARVWVGVAAACAVAALAFAVRRRPVAALGLALLVLPLLPALFVPVLGEGLLGERYLYLPSAGLAVLAAEGWRAWVGPAPARLPVAAAVAGALALAGAAATVAHVPVWHDERSLWTAAVAEAPGSPAAHENLGSALFETGRPAEATVELQRALDLDPDRRVARTQLASALLAQGRVAEAEQQAARVVAEHPRFAGGHAALGHARAARGDYAGAIQAYARSAELDPRIAVVQNALAIAFARAGDLASAELHFREAIRLEPDEPRWAANLAMVLRATGR